MWDKLMARVWSFWHIEEYRQKVSVYAVTIASALIIGIETAKAIVTKWAVIDMFIFVIALTMCIYYAIYIVRHKDEWHGKYDDEPLIEVPLWK